MDGPKPEELDAILRGMISSIQRTDSDVLKIAEAIMRMCKAVDIMADQLKLHEEALAKAGIIEEE